MKTLTAIFEIVYIYVIVLSPIAFISCVHKLREDIVNECKEKNVSKIKKIFPSSEVIGYSINGDYYTYVVLDVNNIKEVDCTCNVHETRIEHIRVIGKMSK